MSQAVKLADLDPQWLRYVADGGLGHVESIDQAQGLMFLCPKCFLANGGPVRTHSVIVWSRSRGVPTRRRQGRGAGHSPALGFTISPSTAIRLATRARIDLSGTAGCQWHGFITNGEAT